jgi:uncharacterized protein
MKRIVMRLIRAYQRWLSPLKRVPTCRFLPTCSEYAVEAVQVHGVAKGLLLALWRLCRCQPLCRGGHDPVKLPEGTFGNGRSG